MEFSNKINGCQLGFKLKIKIKEDDYLNYHIKTHQDGSNVRCTSKKITDIKELFIYKLLHSIEILPEVHLSIKKLQKLSLMIGLFRKKT